MTTNGPVPPDRSRLAGILDVCDQVMGESSRRDHLFDWLQPPGGAGVLVTVDAYYPGHELVVLTEEQPEPEYSLSAHLIPDHGLRLFRIRLADFTGNSGLGFSRLLGEVRRVAALTVAAPATLVPAQPAIRWNQTPAAPAPSPAPFAALPIAPAPVPTFPMAAPPPPDVRQSVTSPFQALVSAVQRYTAAPQPFHMPPEPAPPPVAPPPPPPGPATPPLAEVLQRYVSNTPVRATPPAPPAPPAPAPAAPAWQQHRPTPEPPPPPPPPPPLPYTRTAAPLDPVLAHLVPHAVPDLNRRRVGQRQVEAAARAARFVDARHGGSVLRNAGQASVRSPPGPAPAWRTPVAEWRNEPATSPFAFAFPGAAPAPAFPTRPSASSTRTAAIERALAKGRALPDRHRRPPPEKSVIDDDDIPLAFVVACIVLVEVILGAVLFVAGGPVVLGLGLLLDAAARVLGTVAAARSGKEWGSGWRWVCALGGSPGVAVFAFQRQGGLVAADPAPLAGPVAALAIVVLLVGLGGLPAGI
jgi:hypothetical protein